MSRALIWFRNDLRLSDNLALDNAANNNELVFLYIYDPNYAIGSASKWFLHQALKSLKQDIKQNYNADLLIEFGDSQEIIEKYLADYQIEKVFWNRVYEPEIIQRDIKIKSSLKNLGYEVKSFNSSLFFEPGQIKNGSGDYFKVFTPFWKKCLANLVNIKNPIDAPKEINGIKVSEAKSLDDLRLLPKNPDWSVGWNKLYNVSEANAHEQALSFMKSKMSNYNIGRDFPGQNSTSILSPFIHFGLISPKQLYFKAMMFEETDGLNVFFSEIGWREFSYNLLFNNPDLAKKSVKTKFDNFPWLNNKEHLKKWQTGQTGFPIVDAGMRQLWHTGWMHNRVRMIVASFLTKNLLIDWRIGAEWFNDCLVDADLAANNASWQWVAGSGADAAPYFRIFNPITQSEKFDKNGIYIRKWVPEIAHLTNKEIHNPIRRDNYPEMMIDLKETRERALNIYRNLP
ncbi:MAG: deoxyribodipyrimidine photo-lyase [Rickettsiales bacterium]|nr:deoxyribodipyrimidine photo-lyase [Rickettsiales bacterium]